MPIYEVDCPRHGKQEVYRHGCESVQTAECPVCGAPSPRVWTGVGGPELFTPYYTEALNTGPPLYVGSRKQEKAIEKKTGFVRTG
jgi:hypothetical protein